MNSLDKLEEMINSFPLHFGKKLQQNLLSTLKEARLEEEEYKARSVSWSILDFEGRAKDLAGKNWKEVYNPELFQDALHKMIKNHDCCDGITWNTIDFYLNYLCKI